MLYVIINIITAHFKIMNWIGAVNLCSNSKNYNFFLFGQCLFIFVSSNIRHYIYDIRSNNNKI